MKKLMFICMLVVLGGLAHAQTFGSDTPPNPSPGRPEGALPGGGGAGAPVAEGAVVTMALAAGYALIRRKKENR